MSVKKKINSLQIYRIAVQIIFFILLPGFYAGAFLGLKTLYLGAVSGNLDLSTNLVSFMEAIAVIPVTILLGRFFCGWMCAFGAVSDWLYAFSKKVFKTRFRISEKADSVLKSLKYIYLVLLAALLWNVDWSFLEGTNPWDAFGFIFTVKGVPDIAGAVEYFVFGTILLIIIFAASMFVERFFCRYLCPLGAVFAAVSKVRFLKIKKNRDKCEACKICTNNCPMGIPMYKYDKISTGECIQCLRCTAVCPRNNAQLAVADANVNTIVAGTLAVAAITSIYYTGEALAGGGSGTTSTYTDTAAGKYTDGTYEGSGTGFHGGTTSVSVTVENGNITDVEILSYQDDRPYFERAESSVIAQIIETQSSDVDAVSGATYSSRGIMSAVEDALSITGSSSATYDSAASYDTAEEETNRGKRSHASVEIAEDTAEDMAEDTTDEKDVSAADENTAIDQASAAAVETGAYADGTYEGSGIGFKNRTTTVSVTVSGGLISDVAVISYGDDRPYFERAKSSVISQIIETQSSDVDAVSGATFSSRGIMSAVEDALGGAVN
ncbi:FMN-binding protein [Anaerobium acetethylicum]|uniref:4Fe-4S binding domain-containing protein n=1 Tax=Anaerobium acetethylicum TaxID=1619234 RepID=A0A1D3TS18_9FIRM|nr:FMN-binding protein [Anaerobium acetethylicum]SCP96568.1 4Fe-4S binding domain-containing protein [Anaerobium acetethylicum]